VIETLIAGLGAAVIAELVKQLPTVAAEIPGIVEQVVADFKAQHPEIGAPPPASEEASINAEIDRTFAAENPAKP
jgi:predicted transcriptional regulator